MDVLLTQQKTQISVAQAQHDQAQVAVAAALPNVVDADAMDVDEVPGPRAHQRPQADQPPAQRQRVDAAPPAQPVLLEFDIDDPGTTRLAKNGLKEAIPLNEQSPVALIRPNDTRWMGDFTMTRRFLRLQLPLMVTMQRLQDQIPDAGAYIWTWQERWLHVMAPLATTTVMLQVRAFIAIVWIFNSNVYCNSKRAFLLFQKQLVRSKNFSDSTNDCLDATLQFQY